MGTNCYYEGMTAVLKVAEIRHFSARELCRVGRFATDSGPALQPPEPSQWPNIVPTLLILEDMREHFEKPVFITSGYRDPDYNRAVKGAPDSMHVYFNACDVYLPEVKPIEIYSYLKRHPWADSLGLGLYATFVHVDTRGVLGKPAPARW